MTRHGGSGDSEYNCWAMMIQRCENPNTPGYLEFYGGRGVKVCHRWRESYPAFLEDMGRRPSGVHSLDRFPNKDGNYEPGNVRWATPSEQQANLRNNIHVVVNGEKMLVTHACRALRISRDSVRYCARVHGVDIDVALRAVLYNKQFGAPRSSDGRMLSYDFSKIDLSQQIHMEAL